MIQNSAKVLNLDHVQNKQGSKTQLLMVLRILSLF